VYTTMMFVRYNTDMYAKQKGYTIVELLIAAAIVGLLAAIVVGGLDLVRSKGRDAARIADIKQINGAIENYFDSCYKFPETLDNLVPDCQGNVYISEVPNDPQGMPYKYYVSDTPYGFHLCANLELDYGNNKGKARSAPLAGGDECDGTQGKVFDVLGGALK